MPDRRRRMINQHPRPRKSHHPTDLLPHLRLITVCLTVLTARLFLPIPAMVQPEKRIVHQLPAAVAQLLIMFRLPAIQPYHHLHGLLFIFDFSHLQSFY